MRASDMREFLQDNEGPAAHFAMVVARKGADFAKTRLAEMAAEPDDRLLEPDYEESLDAISLWTQRPLLEIATEVRDMIDASTDTFAMEAFKSLPEKEREEIAQLIAGRLRKPSSIDSVTAEGAMAIKKVIGVLVERELEASRDVLMHRIATLVAERWEAEVDAIVAKKLAEAVAKVKAEMNR